MGVSDEDVAKTLSPASCACACAESASAAPLLQMLAQQMEKERKKHKSLWEEEEEKVSEDPMEIAENSEYAGTLPDIEIPDMANVEIT